MDISRYCFIFFKLKLLSEIVTPLNKSVFDVPKVFAISYSCKWKRNIWYVLIVNLSTSLGEWNTRG